MNRLWMATNPDRTGARTQHRKEVYLQHRILRFQVDCSSRRLAFFGSHVRVANEFYACHDRPVLDRRVTVARDAGACRNCRVVAVDSVDFYFVRVLVA